MSTSSRARSAVTSQPRTSKTTQPKAPRTPKAPKAKAPKLPKPMSAAQRKTLATQQIVNFLSADSQNNASIAALEVIGERLGWDRELQSSLRQKYDELQALTQPTHRSHVDETPPMPPLIRPAGLNRQTPLHILDPYELALDYGLDQLRNVLRRATIDNLKVAVAEVQKHHPDTKPENATSSNSLIDYIVKHVAGPGY